jgi:EAL domain-containing protein (putative c-di-GMP-specific phosphodiesterase class I)
MAMAKSLNLKVTGEGVETAEQAALLDAWECDLGQGYYFGKPLDDKQTGALMGLALATGHVSAATAPTEMSPLLT